MQIYWIFQRNIHICDNLRKIGFETIQTENKNKKVKIE